MSKAAYLKLSLSELGEKAQRTVAMLEDCTVCAQACRVNRLKGEVGICRGGRHVAVSSCGPHFGEETPLVYNTGGYDSLETLCPVLPGTRGV